MHSASSETNLFASSQGIPQFLRKPMFHYHIHMRPQTVSILGQPIHLHSTSRKSVLILSTHFCLHLPSGSFLFYPARTYKHSFPHSYAPPVHPIYMLCPHCIYKFRIHLRLNSDLCHLLHKLVGFYNRDEKCLQRGKLEIIF